MNANEHIIDMLDRLGPPPAGKSAKREIEPNKYVIIAGMTKGGGKLDHIRADVAHYRPETYYDDDDSMGGPIPHRPGYARVIDATYTAATADELRAKLAD